MRATFESWLHRQWTKRGLLAWALSPLSVVFLCIARNRRMKTKPHRFTGSGCCRWQYLRGRHR